MVNSVTPETTLIFDDVTFYNNDYGDDTRKVTSRPYLGVFGGAHFFSISVASVSLEFYGCHFQQRTPDGPKHLLRSELVQSRCTDHFHRWLPLGYQFDIHRCS